jgi:hypothetical protein
MRRGGATLCGPLLGQRRRLHVRTSRLSEARRKLLVQAGDSSCKTEFPRARQSGSDLSEKLSPSERLVEEASNWSEIRYLANDGLDGSPQSSLS